MKRTLTAVLVLLMCVVPTAAAQPGDSAGASIVVDAASGRVLWGHDVDEPRPIASITKLMTALVAAERGPGLSTEVTIRPEWTGIEGSSMYLRAGEKLTIEELLYGLLLVSGNDAAEALAGCCGGERETFLLWMNQQADALEMKNTQFSSPSGLEDEGNYSTAADMALLARKVLENETLRRICSTRSATVAGRTLVNHNKLLWRYDGCEGMKTGYTDQAGRTLVSCARRGEQVLIAVTLNDRNDWADHAALLDYGFSTYPACTLVEEGAVLGSAPVGGSVTPQVALCAGSSFSYPLSAEEAGEWTVKLDGPLTAPLSAGQKVGTVELTVNGAPVGSVDLVCASDVTDDRAEEQSFLGRLWDRILGR